MRTFRGTAALALVLALVRCSSAPAPAPKPPAEPGPAAASTTPEVAVGTVKVTAASLNVRSEPRADAPIVGQVKRGARLSLIRSEHGWSRVQAAGREAGWVLSQHVAAIKGCMPDADFRMVKTPTLAFSDRGAHGKVVVEATVDVRGAVTATKIVSNSTGDATLASMAEKEIRAARFSPPVRDCAPRAFFYTYQRDF